MANLRSAPQLTGEQQSLVEAHLPLARRLANRYRDSHPNHIDDLYSVACLRLCEVAGRFNADRGVTFGAFARPHLVGALLNHVQRVIQREEQALPSGLDAIDPAPPVDHEPSPGPSGRKRPIRLFLVAVAG